MYTRSEFARAERDPANSFNYEAAHDANPGHLFIQLNVVGREESAGSMVFAQPPIVVREFLIFELAGDTKQWMRREAEVSEYKEKVATTHTTLTIFAPSGKLISLSSAAS